LTVAKVIELMSSSHPLLDKRPHFVYHRRSTRHASGFEFQVQIRVEVNGEPCRLNLRLFRRLPCPGNPFLNLPLRKSECGLHA
jgi:hypothetical protein